MDEKQRQEIANFRYGLIAPLVNRRLNNGEQAALLREIASHEYDIPYSKEKSVSIRTLERYLNAYRNGNWEALKPSLRADRLTSREIKDDILQKAMELKIELPSRSVRQIVCILELAKFVEPGVLKESTLSKQFRKQGLTRKQLSQEQADSFRRFEADYRNFCWQGDVQHCLYLPHPEKKGKSKMAYLVVFLDDYSRVVTHGQFYFEERLPRLEDCLKKAILKYGIPEVIYVDNGAIYSSHHFARICGRLGTQLKHSRAGRPQGRGKQEKFFRYVDLSFVPEAYDLIEQGKLTTLAELNTFFAAWLEIAYHQKVHNTFKQRPIDRYNKCEHPIRTMPPHELMEVFLVEETRKADKTGCVSLLGNKYEVASRLAGQKVELRFDPYDMSVIQVWKDGVRQEDARTIDLSMHRRRDDEKTKLSPPPTAPTGLNFVELAHAKYVEQQQKKGLSSLSELVNDNEGDKDHD